MTQKVCLGRIGIWGTGRVGSALAQGLAGNSAGPLTIWGRKAERAQALARQAGGQAAQSPAELAKACDVIALAVADDALEPVAEALAALLPPSAAPFVFHVSGRSGLAPLAPLALRGAQVAAIHPAMTFTGDPAGEVQRMAGARFAITAAQAESAALAHRLVRALGGVAVDVAEAQRPLYHAALCHAANHLVTLMAGSLEALACAGVEDGAALLAPLVRAALENSLAMGLDALSGPLLRGDNQTLAGHMVALERDCPTLRPAYQAMAEATLDALERRGAPPSPAMRQAIAT